MSAVVIGSARVNELGSYATGKKGDQKQKSKPDFSGEVSKQYFYIHKKGWYVLRPKNANVALKIAKGMNIACDNQNIGYSQNDRYGVIKNGVESKTPINADCSSLVRACIIYATGKDVGDFNTSSEAQVLEKSGLFETRRNYLAGMPLYAGDVLVTKTKGHTVVVIEGNAVRELTPTPISNKGPHIQPNYTVNQTYTVRCEGLNVRTKKSFQDPTVLPKATKIRVLKKGDIVKCQATTRIEEKIWMYIGLDNKGREQWCCADSGTESYIK